MLSSLPLMTYADGHIEPLQMSLEVVKKNIITIPDYENVALNMKEFFVCLHCDKFLY